MRKLLNSNTGSGWMQSKVQELHIAGTFMQNAKCNAMQNAKCGDDQRMPASVASRIF